MKLSYLSFALIIYVSAACTSRGKEFQKEAFPPVKIVSAMKNVMWKGQLGSAIDFDTISNKKGLYGIGPESYLTGELLINNGRCFISSVNADKTMGVVESFETSAPFFVYSNVNDWKEILLPRTVRTIRDLENYLDDNTKKIKRPFAFKAIGKIIEAEIHIQNLPKGSKVSSPEEAHLGQVNYSLGEEDVEIIGFFSRKHQGIFTHHDSFLHMHLITKDERKMGHLDIVEIDSMTLYLPMR